MFVFVTFVRVNVYDCAVVLMDVLLVNTVLLMFSRRLHKAEHRNRELEQEMAGLREEILRLTAGRDQGQEWSVI